MPFLCMKYVKLIIIIFFQGTSLYPSLLAHHASLSHLHPIFILIRLRPDADPHFVLRNPTTNLKLTYSPIQSEMPCDIHMLNLRTLASSSGASFVPSRNSVLNLHRLGFDCNFEMIGNCSYHNGTVSFSWFWFTSFLSFTNICIFICKYKHIACMLLNLI